MSTDDPRKSQRLESQREERFKVIDRMREAFKDVAEVEVDREVDKAIAEIRAEYRAQEEQARP